MTTTTTRKSSSTRFCHRPNNPTEAELLRQDITALCHQTDRRLGNPPGTAERGTYFWHWPAATVTSLDVLTQLHADATKFLHTLTNPAAG